MNIKSILIGSVAALAAASGAKAADAIVAAEPEPVEYVRVCDAFGTGYFYIPGTETCIRIGGYVRVQLNVGDDASPLRGSSEYSDYDIFARGRLRVDAKNDTEFGPLWSRVQIRVRASEGSGDPTNTDLEEGFIELAGLRVGKFYSWWDDDLFSESDWLNNNTNFASIRYTYTGEAFSAALSLDELESTRDANLGVTGFLSGAFGPVTANLLGSYDTDYEEFAIRGIASAEIGPGTLEVAAIYSSGYNNYYDAAEWTVAADYAFRVNDKLTVAPYAQYFWDYKQDDATGDAWLVALTAEYKIVDGLTALATVEYLDEEDGDDFTGGFLRLQRDF